MNPRNSLVTCALLLLGVLDLPAATSDDDPTAPVRPPIESVLRRWADAMRVDEPREIHFKRYEYDEVFLIEKRGRGTFALDSHGRGRLVIGPEEIADDAVSARRERDVPFEIQPAGSHIWYWTDDHFYILDVASKTAHCCSKAVGGWVFGLTAPHPGRFFPLLYNVDADALTKRFHWEYGTKTDETVFHLVGGRKTEVPSSNTRLGLQWFDPPDPLQALDRAELLIDRGTHRTRALRLVQVNTEVVCVVEKDVLMGAEAAEFWQPDLSGFGLVGDACR